MLLSFYVSMFLSGPLALNIPGFGQVEAPPNVPSGASAPSNIITASLNLLVIAGIAAALIFVIYGGILWIISQGDKQKLDHARRTITFSIIGLIIMVLAFSIVQIVGTLLGVSFFGKK